MQPSRFCLNNLVTMHLWYKSILKCIFNTQDNRSFPECLSVALVEPPPVTNTVVKNEHPVQNAEVLSKILYSTKSWADLLMCKRTQNTREKKNTGVCFLEVDTSSFAGILYKYILENKATTSNSPNCLLTSFPKQVWFLENPLVLFFICLHYFAMVQ